MICAVEKSFAVYAATASEKAQGGNSIAEISLENPLKKPLESPIL